METKCCFSNYVYLLNDIFLLICTIYHTENEQGIFEQVLHGDLDFSSDPWPSISEDAKDLVRGMLVRDPRKRLTAHEVLCEYSQQFVLSDI